MARHQVILVGGGSRSGKSAFALKAARALGRRRLFIATAEARDDEMYRRIEHHRQARGEDFHTVEEPLTICGVLEREVGYDVVVIDCLTLWLSNLLMEARLDEEILRRIDELTLGLCQRQRHAVVVTNEVGLGLVPETPLGRRFRDLAGMAHQRLASLADAVYFGTLGVMLRIKPAPIIPVEGCMIP
jgi:adenosylcobinamide kinase / adenosylcobinamide-phosphate guanylyltransferase